MVATNMDRQLRIKALIEIEVRKAKGYEYDEMMARERKVECWRQIARLEATLGEQELGDR